MTERISPDGDYERLRWSASGANWDRWADAMAEAADRINGPLLALAGIQPGETVLDLATGAGEPALSAADLVGPDGLVIGTDLVASMLSGMRRRMAGRGTTAIRLALADMQALPFRRGVIDRVTCRFGLMFVPDADQSCREICRVLRPGGTAVAAVWGPMAENTLFQVLSTVVDEVLGPDPARGLPTLFRFAEAGSLSAVFQAAGLTDCREEALRQSLTVPAVRPFWRPTLDMGFAPRLACVDESTRALLEQAIIDRFAAMACSDGMVSLSMHVRLGHGRR